MSRSAAVATGRVGYVLKVFPRVSETFVINEIRALESLGERVCIFSLHHGDGNVPHGILGHLRSPLVYVDDHAVEDDAVSKTQRQLARELRLAREDRNRFLPRKYVRLAVALRESMREHDVVHLHAHFASRAGHVAALASRLAGCSYSVTAHAKDIYHEDVDREVLRWKLTSARFVVTVTQYNQSYLHELVASAPGARAEIETIYNGVDLERFHPPRAAAGGTPLVLGVGRLVEKKGFPILVEACRLLRDGGRDFRCEIIGGGPQEGDLRQQIARAGLGSSVVLRGVLPTESVAAALPGAAVVVLPCIVARDGNVDALPTVLLEAMAAGRPVVSTRLSGIPEIVADGETGLLVPPDDAAALAEAIGRLIADPGMAESMGRGGRSRAEALFDLYANAARLRRRLRSEDGARPS